MKILLKKLSSYSVIFNTRISVVGRYFRSLQQIFFCIIIDLSGIVTALKKIKLTFIQKGLKLTKKNNEIIDVKMKKHYNSFYIFCTFRGQLILLVVFISINLFNVANYAYTEGCSNLLGDAVRAVDLAIKNEEDLNVFRLTVPFGIFQEMPFNYPIEETINFSEYLSKIVLTDLNITNKWKLITMLIDLNVLSLKYKYAGMDHYQEMLTDVNQLFINRRYVNGWDFSDFHQRILFLKELIKFYDSTNRNPIVLEAITVFRKSINLIYN